MSSPDVSNEDFLVSRCLATDVAHDQSKRLLPVKIGHCIGPLVVLASLCKHLKRTCHAQCQAPVVLLPVTVTEEDITFRQTGISGRPGSRN